MEIELKMFQYILRLLHKAHYEYDSSVKAWVGWIEGFPGIYAQAKNVEGVRSELISTLEEYILLDIKEGKHLPGFSRTIRRYAKTNEQTQTGPKTIEDRFCRSLSRWSTSVYAAGRFSHQNSQSSRPGHWCPSAPADFARSRNFRRGIRGTLKLKKREIYSRAWS